MKKQYVICRSYDEPDAAVMFGDELRVTIGTSKTPIIAHIKNLRASKSWPAVMKFYETSRQEGLVHGYVSDNAEKRLVEITAPIDDLVKEEDTSELVLKAD